MRLLFLIFKASLYVSGELFFLLVITDVYGGGAVQSCAGFTNLASGLVLGSNFVKKSLNINLAIILIVTQFVIASVRILLRRILLIVLGLLELAVPGAFNFVDLVTAEIDPLLSLSVLLALLSSHVVILRIHVTGFIVDGILSQVAQFKGNLDNLAHVCGGGGVSRFKLELFVLVHHLLHKVLHDLNVFLVEGLFDGVQRDDSLLVGNRAERIQAEHVQHRVDHLLAEEARQDFVVFQVRNFAQN